MTKRKKIEMSDIETPVDVAETKKRKSFVRGPQKVWAILTIKDADGNELDVREGKGYTVDLMLSKDQSGVIKLLLNGAQAFVTELEVPKAADAAADEGTDAE